MNSEPVTVLVTQLGFEADDVVSVRLSSRTGPLPPWEPGAHLDLLLPVGIVRQYSIVEAAADLSWYRIAVLKDAMSRGGSEYVHLFLRPGQEVAIHPPLNHFGLVDADEYRFLAGGIGITPLVSMIAAVHGEGRRWTLDYAARSTRQMAFLDRFGHAGHVRLWPSEDERRLPLEDVLSDPSPGAAVYCCGPARLMDAAVAAGERLGWEPRQIHTERFKPSVRIATDDRPVRVRAARSGVVIDVGADETVLSALERAGVPVPCSCRTGVCGTCETLVLEGVPDHRDDVLTEEQRGGEDTMLVCVSRAFSDLLVLDL